MKIPMWHIYNHDATERIDFLNKMSYTKAKSLPQRFDSKVSTVICGDEVVIVAWISPVMTIQIKNKLLSESYKNYFNILWESAK